MPSICKLQGTTPTWSQELLRQAQVMGFHWPLAHVADDGILRPGAGFRECCN